MRTVLQSAVADREDLGRRGEDRQIRLEGPEEVDLSVGERIRDRAVPVDRDGGVLLKRRFGGVLDGRQIAVEGDIDVERRRVPHARKIGDRDVLVPDDIAAHRAVDEPRAAERLDRDATVGGGVDADIQFGKGYVVESPDGIPPIRAINDIVILHLRGVDHVVESADLVPVPDQDAAEVDRLRQRDVPQVKVGGQVVIPVGHRKELLGGRNALIVLSERNDVRGTVRAGLGRMPVVFVAVFDRGDVACRREILPVGKTDEIGAPVDRVDGIAVRVLKGQINAITRVIVRQRSDGGITDLQIAEDRILHRYVGVDRLADRKTLIRIVDPIDREINQTDLVGNEFDDRALDPVAAYDDHPLSVDVDRRNLDLGRVDEIDAQVEFLPVLDHVVVEKNHLFDRDALDQRRIIDRKGLAVRSVSVIQIVGEGHDDPIRRATLQSRKHEVIALVDGTDLVVPFIDRHLVDGADPVGVEQAQGSDDLRPRGSQIGYGNGRRLFRGGLELRRLDKRLRTRAVVRVVGVGDADRVLVVAEKVLERADGQIFGDRHVVPVQEFDLGDRSNLIGVGDRSREGDRRLRCGDVVDREGRHLLRCGSEFCRLDKRLRALAVVRVVGVGDADRVLVVAEKVLERADGQIFGDRHVVPVQEFDLGDRSNLIGVGDRSSESDRRLRYGNVVDQQDRRLFCHRRKLLRRNERLRALAVVCVVGVGDADRVLVVAEKVLERTDGQIFGDRHVVSVQEFDLGDRSNLIGVGRQRGEGHRSLRRCDFRDRNGRHLFCGGLDFRSLGKRPFTRAVVQIIGISDADRVLVVAENVLERADGQIFGDRRVVPVQEFDLRDRADLIDVGDRSRKGDRRLRCGDVVDRDGRHLLRCSPDRDRNRCVLPVKTVVVGDDRIRPVGKKPVGALYSRVRFAHLFAVQIEFQTRNGEVGAFVVQAVIPLHGGL